MDIVSEERAANLPAQVFDHPSHDFNSTSVTLELDYEKSTHRSYHLAFTSPAPSGIAENDTVHANFYEPTYVKNYPFVLFLHGWMVNRPVFEASACKRFADNGFGTLLMTLPYHNNRTPKGYRSGSYLLDTDLNGLFTFLHQAVLEARTCLDWAEASLAPKLTTEGYTIIGESMGSVISQIVSGVDPRIGQMILYISGGNLLKILQTGLFLKKLRKGLAKNGYTKETYAADRERFNTYLTKIGVDPPEYQRDHEPECTQPVSTGPKPISTPHNKQFPNPSRPGPKLHQQWFAGDPLTHSLVNRQKPILMINATRDYVIPKDCTLQLWEALDRPEIYWLRSGHSSFAFHYRKIFKFTLKFLERYRTGGQKRPSTE